MTERGAVPFVVWWSGTGGSELPHSASRIQARRACLVSIATLLFVSIAGAAGAQTKVVIRSLESGDVHQVQFNPTEISIKKSVPWKTAATPQGGPLTANFAGPDPATLHVQLFFDAGSADVSPLIAPLQQFAKVDPATKRPPLVQFEWGTSFPTFRGVIEQLDVKYSLFLPDGTPLRATVDLVLREASRARAKTGNLVEVTTCDIDADCPSSESCFNGACAPLP